MKRAELKNTLKSLTGLAQPTRYLDHKDYLAEVYRELKAHLGGAYSYVQFTEDLGFGACNAMYLIIHGQRPLTIKGAKKIVEALGLTGLSRQYFLKMVESAQVTSPGKREGALRMLVELKSKALPTEIDRQQLRFYNHWYNAAILELLALPRAKDDPKWISKRLMPTVPPGKVQEALELLTHLGHLVKDEKKGRLVPAQSTFSTGEEVMGLAVVRYHQQMIERAKESITQIAPDEREISAVTIAVPEAMKTLIKHEIAALRKRLLEMSKNATDADEIVQVNFQMFPLAKGD